MINHQFIGSFPIQTSISRRIFRYFPTCCHSFLSPLVFLAESHRDSGGPGSESSRAAWLPSDLSDPSDNLVVYVGDSMGDTPKMIGSG
jgi:hypothetical protein